jgi:hypothetical protein
MVLRTSDYSPRNSCLFWNRHLTTPLGDWTALSRAVFPFPDAHEVRIAAIESCGPLDWENLCLEAANQYRERLLERSQEPFVRWNDVVDAVKPVAQTLVREKTRDMIEAHNLPAVFIGTVDWDILHLCMEAEYADVYLPGFYACQAYWYVKGHVPCG